MKLSVIIPAYNAESSITECVQSVLVGLVDDYEILVIDDGSVDQTARIVTDLALSSPDVRLLRHPGGRNRGVAASRNLGLAEARGHYISFLDADDYCEPTRFLRSLQLLEERNDIDGVLVTVGVVFEQNSEDDCRDFLPDELDHSLDIEPDKFAIATLQGRSRFHISNNVFRVSLLEKSGVFDIRRQLGEEDTDFWLRLALCGRFIVSDQTTPQVYYRRHSANNWKPRVEDVYRDLKMLGGVLDWAKLSPLVERSNFDALQVAFIQKLLFCQNLIRNRQLAVSHFEIFSLAVREVPRIVLLKAFWSNLLRTQSTDHQ